MKYDPLHITVRARLFGHSVLGRSNGRLEPGMLLLKFQVVLSSARSAAGRSKPGKCVRGLKVSRWDAAGPWEGGGGLIFIYTQLGNRGVSKTVVNATKLPLALRTDRRFQTHSSRYAVLYCNIPAGRTFGTLRSDLVIKRCLMWCILVIASGYMLRLRSLTRWQWHTTYQAHHNICFFFLARRDSKDPFPP